MPWYNESIYFERVMAFKYHIPVGSNDKLRAQGIFLNHGKATAYRDR
jgi:hypothetical protein